MTLIYSYNFDKLHLIDLNAFFVAAQLDHEWNSSKIFYARVKPFEESRHSVSLNMDPQWAQKRNSTKIWYHDPPITSDLMDKDCWSLKYPQLPKRSSSASKCTVSMSDYLWGIIWMQRFTGAHPIYRERDQITGRWRYISTWSKGHLTDLLTVCSIAITVVDQFCALLFFTNVMLDVPFPLRMFKPNKQSFEGTVSGMLAVATKANHLINNISRSIYAPLHWSSDPSMVRFLHDVDSFQAKFDAIFRSCGKRLEPKFVAFRILNTLYSFGSISAGLGMVFSSAAPPFEYLSTLSYYTFLWMTTFYLFELCFENAFVIQSFKLLGTLYDELLLALQADSSKGRPSAAKIQSWRCLIHDLRMLCSDFSSVITYRQLTSVAQSFLQTILSIFLFLYMVGLGAVNSPVFAVLPVYFLLNVYLKAFVAGGITEAEKRFANALERMTFSDPDATFEAKYIYDMLTQAPTVVNLGGYITLKKSFILTVISQCVTYLIVIFQFQNAQI